MSVEPQLDGPGPSETKPGPSEAEQSSRAGRKRRWWRSVAFAGGSLLLAGGLTFLLQRRGEASPATVAAPEPDVPHVQGDHIRFSDSFVRRAGIRMARVRVGELVPVIEAVGTVDFSAEHVAAVGARLRGLVSRVLKFEGDTVRAGETLARVESPELGEAQAKVSMLTAEREAAQLNAEREAKLAVRNLTTAREVEVASVEARKASLLLGAAQQKVAALGGGARADAASLGTHELRSPIRGTVVLRNVAPGQFIEGHLVAFKVANLDHLWVELDVFERNLNRIRTGDHAELKPLSGGIGTIRGVVAKVASNIDQETHSAKVRIEVENPDHQLRPGQAVKAAIQASGGKLTPRPLVPTGAITFVDGKPTLFVAEGPHVVRVASVRIGANDGHETEITDGLNETDEVVTDGAFALKSELFR
jgi:cobalt-zinc-cadmium efflux system membrane fusion protein